MQEVVWSEHPLRGGQQFRGKLERAKVDPHPHANFPRCFIPSEGKIDVPIVEARKDYYRDISVLAIPSTGVVRKEEIIDLTTRMNAEGEIIWDAPAGDWTLYRFGHTTTGAMIQPAQLWRISSRPSRSHSLAA